MIKCYIIRFHLAALIFGPYLGFRRKYLFLPPVRIRLALYYRAFKWTFQNCIVSFEVPFICALVFLGSKVPITISIKRPTAWIGGLKGSFALLYSAICYIVWQTFAMQCDICDKHIYVCRIYHIALQMFVTYIAEQTTEHIYAVLCNICDKSLLCYVMQHMWHTLKHRYVKVYAQCVILKSNITTCAYNMV